MTHSAFIDLDDTVYAPIREARAQWLAAVADRESCQQRNLTGCEVAKGDEARAYRRFMHATQEYRPGCGIQEGDR